MCANCGSPLRVGAAFCSGCGAPTATSSGHQSPNSAQSLSGGQAPGKPWDSTTQSVASTFREQQWDIGSAARIAAIGFSPALVFGLIVWLLDWAVRAGNNADPSIPSTGLGGLAQAVLWPFSGSVGLTGSASSNGGYGQYSGSGEAVLALSGRPLLICALIVGLLVWQIRKSILSLEPEGRGAKGLVGVAVPVAGIGLAGVLALTVVARAWSVSLGPEVLDEDATAGLKLLTPWLSASIFTIAGVAIASLLAILTPAAAPPQRLERLRPVGAAVAQAAVLVMGVLSVLGVVALVVWALIPGGSGSSGSGSSSVSATEGIVGLVAGLLLVMSFAPNLGFGMLGLGSFAGSQGSVTGSGLTTIPGFDDANWISTSPSIDVNLLNGSVTVPVTNDLYPLAPALWLIPVATVATFLLAAMWLALRTEGSSRRALTGYVVAMAATVVIGLVFAGFTVSVDLTADLVYSSYSSGSAAQSVDATVAGTAMPLTPTALFTVPALAALSWLVGGYILGQMSPASRSRWSIRCSRFPWRRVPGD